MKFQTISVLLALIQQLLAQDQHVVNDLIKPEEVYNFTYSTDSDVWWRSVNATKYYCIYRSHWTKDRHPNEYPKLARWSDLIMYSTNKEYRPWLKNRATTLGVEKIAETGFVDTFESEMKAAGDLVYTYSVGKGFFVDQDHPSVNYVYIPPIEVSFDYPFLNAIGGMSPSPDWFTGFYLFDTVDEYDRTFWQRFTLFTYPWDAGTDAGESYTAEDRDLDPAVNVERIFPNNVPENGAFLSPDGKEVLPVGEFDCDLYVCPVEDPNCNRPNWPPKNYCDLLKYPKCASYCDPQIDEGCEECKGNGYEPKSVFLPGCCESGHDPRYGPTCEEGGASAAARLSVLSLWTSLLMSAWGLILALQ